MGSTKKIILLLLFPFLTFAQSYYPDNRIIVVGEATIDIPADKVIFNIQLKFTDSTDIKAAYARHKSAESSLVIFLKESEISNKNITYTPISVGKALVYNGGKRDIEFGTQQNISVTLEDVKKYAEFMMKLVTAGFADVKVSFISSKENDFQDTLIQKAIAVARKKAEAMAKASDRVIVKILKVSDTGETDSTFIYREGNSFSDLSDITSENTIIEIPQTISKRYRVKVVFALK